MFVQNLEGIAISCFKIKAQKPNKGWNVGVRTPAGPCVSSQEGSGREEAPLPLPGAHLLPQMCPLPLASSPWPGWRSQESQPPQRAASRTFHGCGHRSRAGSFPSTRSHHPEWKWGPSPLRGHPPLCPTQNGLGKTTTMSHPPRWGSELGNQQAEGTWGQEVWAQVGGVDSASLRLCPFPGRLWPRVSGLGPEGCPPHLHTHLTQTRDSDTSEDQHVHNHR